MIKQWVYLICFCFISTIGLGQDFKNVDALVLTYPTSYAHPKKLAEQIATDFSTDLDKARAVYTWITNNVAYEPTNVSKRSYRYKTEAELEKKRAQFRQETAIKTIKTTKAICHGYATLFTALCDELALESRVVLGAAKTMTKEIGRPYNSNHAWNIVKIDNKEYLIDSTWGSGSYSNSFRKDVDYFFFMTDPMLLIKHHYPDDYKNALLKERVSKSTFVDEPIYYNLNYPLITPKSGTIKKGAKGRMVKFTFTSEKKIENISYKIGDASFYDPEFTNEDTIEFSIYISNLTKGRELTIFFDYKAVVGLKIE